MREANYFLSQANTGFVCRNESTINLYTTGQFVPFCFWLPDVMATMACTDRIDLLSDAPVALPLDRTHRVYIILYMSEPGQGVQFCRIV